jgi:hypothetical protein
MQLTDGVGGSRAPLLLLSSFADDATFLVLRRQMVRARVSETTDMAAATVVAVGESGGVVMRPIHKYVLMSSEHERAGAGGWSWSEVRQRCGGIRLHEGRRNWNTFESIRMDCKCRI